MMRCIPLIKCFSSHAITISCLAPILSSFEAALHCKSISFWRDSVFVKRLDGICTVTLAAMLLQSLGYSAFLGTPQASPSCSEKIKDCLERKNHTVKAVDPEC